MSTRTQSVPARTERPEGQPGTVRTGYRRRDGREGRWGLTYPAVQMRSGVVVFWRDTETESPHWIVAPGQLAESFEAGPEWQANCPHSRGGVPYRWCDEASENDCIAQQRDDERTWGR